MLVKPAPERIAGPGRAGCQARVRFASSRTSGYGSRSLQLGLAGARVSDIFREIDEELRRDNLLKLWSRYGRYVVAVVVLALAIAGGFVAWRDHQHAERLAQSARYAGAVALARAGKTADAAIVFKSVAREGGGYSVLASFEDAALLAKSGDHKGALAAYDRIAASSAVDPVFRDLAILHAVMQSPPHADPKAAIARLAPLTAPGDPWRPTALELTAAARLQLGEQKSALGLYKNLADDPATPRDLRARAAEMVAALAP